MKTLSDYTESLQTQLFHDTGAFFAFSTKQFYEKKEGGVKYKTMSHGLICPHDKVDELSEGLEQIIKQGIKEDLEENGKDAIIQRELGNYECQITNDITDVIDALEDYGITEAEIKEGYKLFFQKCIDNDWF